MKHIVTITMGPSEGNFDRIIRFQNQEIRMSQYGTDFDLKLVEKLIRQFDGDCDVIALSGIPHPIHHKRKVFIHSMTKKLKNICEKSYLVDGQIFRKCYIPWTLRQYLRENHKLFSRQRIWAYSGLLTRPMVEVFEEMHSRVLYGDPYFFLNHLFCFDL